MSTYNPQTDTPDLSGKVALVTGGNSGMGFETVKHLASRGAKVYMGARNAERGLKALEKLMQELGSTTQIELFLADLSSIKDTKRAAEDLLKKEERLDILVNNAAFRVPKDYVVTEEGLEASLATNFFGPLELTSTLMPLLKKAAIAEQHDVRIVNVSSEAYTQATDVRHIKSYHDLDSVHDSSLTAALSRYGLSKLTMIWLTRELQRRFDEALIPIIVVTSSPGRATTNSTFLIFTTVFFWPLNLLAWFFAKLLFASAKVAVAPTLFCATSKKVSSQPEKFKGAMIDRKLDVQIPRAPGMDADLAKSAYEVGLLVIEEVLKNGKMQ